MCFSATASFTAGVVLTTAGIGILKKAKKKREVPFAAIPLLFGIQQIIEGFVWLSLKWDNTVLNSIMSHAFFLFSNIGWPIFVPLAVLGLETVWWRRGIISFFELVGFSVAAFFVSFMLTSPILGAVKDHCIVYSYPSAHLNTVVVMYVVAVCGSFFASSNKEVNFIGLLVLASFVVTYLFYAEALVSVWCFFAAVLSIFVYRYFSIKSL